MQFKITVEEHMKSSQLLLVAGGCFVCHKADITEVNESYKNIKFNLMFR